MLNRRPRRQMHQMNVVPYIDVMLVLLVIFMVTTPMFSSGVIDVPSVSHSQALDSVPIEVIVDGPGHILLKMPAKTLTVSSLKQLSVVLRPWVGTDHPFAISARQDMQYADVLQVADALHSAGIKRVALTVKQR